MALKNKAAPGSSKNSTRKSVSSITRSATRPGLRPLTRSISGLKAGSVSAPRAVKAREILVPSSTAGGGQGGPPRPRREGLRARVGSATSRSSSSTAAPARARKSRRYPTRKRKSVAPVLSKSSSASSADLTAVDDETPLGEDGLQSEAASESSVNDVLLAQQRDIRFQRRGETNSVQSWMELGRMLGYDMNRLPETRIWVMPKPPVSPSPPQSWTEKIDDFRVVRSSRRFPLSPLSLRPMGMDQDASGGVVPIGWADDVQDILGSVSPTAVPGSVNHAMYNVLTRRPGLLSISPLFDPTHRWVLQSKDGTANSVTATRFIQIAEGLQRYPAEHLVSAAADIESSFPVPTDDRCQFLEAMGARLMDVSRAWPQCRHARERDYALRFGGRIFRFKDFDMNPDCSSAKWSFQIFEVSEFSSKSWLIAQGETNATGANIFMGLDWSIRQSNYTDELALLRYVLSCISGKSFEVRDLPIDAPSLYLSPY